MLLYSVEVGNRNQYTETQFSYTFLSLASLSSPWIISVYCTVSKELLYSRIRKSDPSWKYLCSFKFSDASWYFLLHRCLSALKFCSLSVSLADMNVVWIRFVCGLQSLYSTWLSMLPVSNYAKQKFRFSSVFFLSLRSRTHIQPRVHTQNSFLLLSL